MSDFQSLLLKYGSDIKGVKTDLITLNNELISVKDSGNLNGHLVNITSYNSKRTSDVSDLASDLSHLKNSLLGTGSSKFDYIYKLNNLNLKTDDTVKEYQILLDERGVVNSAALKNVGLSNKNTDASLQLNRNSYAYANWLVLAVLVVVYLFKAFFFPKANNRYYRHLYWYALIMLFIVTSFKVGTAPGLLVWAFIFAYIILLQLNIIPPP
jgi:hypothetical protein